MTTEKKNPRWVQRFENYKKAFARLENLVLLSNEKKISEVEQEALIKRFEYTQELSWKVIKDFYESLGEVNIQGSKDAFELAFQRGLVQNGAVLMQTIKSRNESSHTYNEDLANEVHCDVVEKYYAIFLELKNALEKEYNERFQ